MLRTLTARAKGSGEMAEGVGRPPSQPTGSATSGVSTRPHGGCLSTLPVARRMPTSTTDVTLEPTKHRPPATGQQSIRLPLRDDVPGSAEQLVPLRTRERDVRTERGAGDPLG